MATNRLLGAQTGLPERIFALSHQVQPGRLWRQQWEEAAASRRHHMGQSHAALCHTGSWQDPGPAAADICQPPAIARQWSPESCLKTPAGSVYTLTNY